MQVRIKRILLLFSVTLPLTFVLLFLGYFPVHYDVVLQTDNIAGEGICQTYVCPPNEYAAFYKLTFYFGTELKKATLKGFHYDVDTLKLITSDVSEFDIVALDSYVNGIHLSHYDAVDMLPDGERAESSQVSLYSSDGVLHVKTSNPDEGATVELELKFIPTWFWITYFVAIISIAFLLAVLLSFIIERIPTIMLLLFRMTCIVIVLLAGCFFCGSLSYVTYANFLLNWLLVFSVSLLLDAVTLPCLGTVLTMGFTTLWYIANYYVIQFRSKPIMPADLSAAGTAAEVMGAYNFTPPWQMVVGVLVVIVYAVILVVFEKKSKPLEEQAIKRKLIRRSISAAFAVALMFIGINTNTFKSLNSFAWDAMLMKSFHEEGMVLTYLKSAFNSGVKRPEGYSREIVEGYLEDYQNVAATETEGIQPTNIIMVMNEAFADLRTVGLNPTIDVMPYIDGLQENTVEGSLYVSVFGGGTCNTEFEALTGNTLAFLGTGVYPYTENVTEPLFSLAQYFKNMGYMTNAFHANLANNWNRNMVYPNLGFEDFHSIEDYEANSNVTYLHEHPADISDYLYMEAVSEENKNLPRFLFDVTMQNHSGYERWLDVEKAESVAENGSDLYVDSQVYLSLIKASDDEVSQLIETYRNSDEPTMIVFFGDHQPGLPSTAIDEIYTNISCNLDLYKSKFFIWTNYDSPELHQTGLSANYMPWLILDQGNFPKPPFIQMLEEVYSKYPIISSQGVMDIDGNIYTGVAEIMDDPLIQKYQYIQYANLFNEIDSAWFEVE